MNTPGGFLPPATLRWMTADPGPWLSCDDCFRLVDRYVDGLFATAGEPDAEVAAMPAHLSGCSACSEEATTLLLLAASDAGIDPTTVLHRLSVS